MAAPQRCCWQYKYLQFSLWFFSKFQGITISSIFSCIRERESTVVKNLFKTVFLKQSFSLIRVGTYVRPKRIALIVNSGMLELSCRFQTFNADFCKKKYLRKCKNSIIINRKSVSSFKYVILDPLKTISYMKEFLHWSDFWNYDS